MKLVLLLRLILKHLILLIIMPLILAGLVTLLTRESRLSFTSSTVLYTGLASGSSIEMDKSFNYFATNTAFDNLINIIKSRETEEEVAIRLLSQHLLLQRSDPKYISQRNYTAFKKIIPAYIYGYVAKSSNAVNRAGISDSYSNGSTDIADSVNLFPASVNKSDYEKTVANITALMKSSDTNFVYKLLNFDDPHYSIKEIATIKVDRLSSSDLIKLTYEADDPGICQQTLAIFNEVCINNYKIIKENRSDAVVKYFEGQLIQANLKLKKAEDQLLAFNKSNNIINYYEQSKAVAVVKEDMEVDYNNKKAQLAGAEAVAKKLEEKLSIQQLVQVKSGNVLELRKELGDINYKIAATEAESVQDDLSKRKMIALKIEREAIQDNIKKSVGELYHYQNSIEGLPVSSTLSDWINTVIESENLRAKLKVMDQRNKDFQNQYAVYAPAGANIKRIEREISVSEQGYLEILHGLNLAKLKLQDNALTSNLKTVDPPYFPLQPVATKRFLLVLVAAVLGFIVMLGVILAMEYLDDTLKNVKRAEKILRIPSLGMFPKLLLHPGSINLPVIQSRLLNMTSHNIEQALRAHPSEKMVMTVLYVSTAEKEGKSVIAGNLARKLKQEGKKVLLLNYSGEQRVASKNGKYPLLTKMLGYQDPRIDHKNSFLADPSEYLSPTECFYYTINARFFEIKDYSEILDLNNIKLSFIPEYVFIELPGLISNNYPAALVQNAELTVLICRSNRLWIEADQTALNKMLPLCKGKIQFVINGVELNEAEAVLGDLPKKASPLRKKIKNFVRFQFFSRNHI